jgi:citrate synthase
MSNGAAPQESRVIPGLEGVIACESAITFIDGQQGVLSYRGYDIHEIAETTTFEEVTFLLWEGRLPTRSEAETFGKELARLRPLDPQILSLIRSSPEWAHPMARLRTAVSFIGEMDPQADVGDRAADLAKAKNLAAKLSTVVAAMARLSRGLEPIAPSAELDHASNYLYMLTGRVPDEASRRALDATLILYADHELNASTFACRVVTGTLSDLYSAVVAGIGALKGPLHGGAIDDAMRLFQDIGSVDNVRSYVDAALEQKRRLPGFGHRVYRVLDPRAIHLKKMAEQLARASDEPHWYDIAMATQDYMYERKRLNANVDYYASLVLYYLGFPLHLFTNFIASTRVVGWTAHILEQRENNRLIRPRAQYTGPLGLKLADR